MDKPFQVYKSSAGSGKTYTLAKAYITLALSQPDNFKHILAVTFTNKAAEEMKSRILMFLRAMSKDDHELVPIIAAELNLDRKVLVRQSGILLREILHNYSYFTITTIDTFFHRVIRTFAREIGLQAGFEIEMDTDLVLDSSINSMLASLAEDAALTQWLIRFSENMLLDGEGYDFLSNIKKLGQKLFSEDFKQLGIDLSTDIDRKEIKALQNRLFQTRTVNRQILKDSAQELLQEIQQEGLTIDDFAYKGAGVLGFVERCTKGESSEPGTRVIAAAESAEGWYTKNSKRKDEIHALAEKSLMPKLVDLLIKYRDTTRLVNTADLLNQYLYTFGILQNLSAKIREYRDREEVLLISDLPSFLRDIVRDNEAPYIYEKVGTRYHHFLIDEFQDTSGFQWDNFRPLIENSVASGNFNMVVGDIKQSIYRWRGGDWNILLEQIEQDIGTDLTATHALNTNYRSGGTIINFNNHLFQALPEMLSEALLSDYAGVEDDAGYRQTALNVVKLQKAYSETVQETPGGKSLDGGYVEVSFLSSEAREFTASALQWTVSKIEKMQDSGYALNQIAILVRSNLEAKRLVDTLLQKATQDSPYRYDVVSAEALYIESAQVSKVILGVCRYLLHPQDRITLVAIARAYQQNILESGISDLDITMHPDPVRLLPEGFLKTVESLLRMPIFELVEALIRLFELDRLRHEIAYLQAFQDAVLDFSAKANGNLNAFLDWWTERGCKRTISSGASDEAIQVLTIHKAKGLQFPVVLIPFCNWSLDHSASFDNMIWVEPGKQFTNQEVRLPVKYSSKLANSLFQIDYEREKASAYLDNLNLLYVACTRAENALFVAAPPSKKGEVKNVGHTLHQHLEAKLNQETGSYLEGSLARFSPDNLRDSRQETIGQYISNEWSDKLKIRESSYDMLSTAKSEPVEYGNLIHHALSYIYDPGDKEHALARLEKEYAIDEQGLGQVSIELDALFADPVFSSWFNEGYSAQNEVAILTRDGTTKRLDKVLFQGTSTIVIDFKTGLPKARDVQQVEQYKSLLEDMGYPDVQGYLYYIGEKSATRI